MHRNLLADHQVTKLVDVLRASGRTVDIQHALHHRADNGYCLIIDDAVRSAIPTIEQCLDVSVPIAIAVNTNCCISQEPHW